MRFYDIDPRCDDVSWLSKASIVFIQLLYLAIVAAGCALGILTTVFGSLVMFTAHVWLSTIVGATITTIGLLASYYAFTVLRLGPMRVLIVPGVPARALAISQEAVHG